MADRLEDLRTALADRYEIEKEIGHGGMANVYLARDLKHHRQVAVKVLRPDLAAALGPERFLREIEIAANLTHPHILPLHDSGEADGFLYYVMPYIEGDTLRERIEKEGELPVAEAVRIIREVVDALAFAHSKGVVHRDIKPDNVMLSGRHAMVTDFGVAKAISEATGRNQLTTAGVALGTPAYMSPEQATADPHVDHRADIYAVGAMAYELLTGRVPFVGATPQAVLAAQVTEEPDPVSKYRDQVPSELETVVMKCLAKKPADRFQTAEEMLPHLETMATSGGITPTATQPHQAQKRAGLRHPAALAVGAALVLASAFMFWRGFGTENESGLDPNVLLVAPFDVFDPDLEDVWREGMAQTVSHILDGAGPLRSVPTSVVMRGWSGTADVATATAAAASHGAGLALFGRLVGAGGDSVRLSATLLDVGAGVAINDFNVWGSTSGAVHLADSLAVLVMAELSRSRSIAVAHLNSLGSSSPPALKAFLQAEQHYRRFALDSARFYYARAIELDTTFALAYNHLGWASAWTVGAPQPMFLRAAALNHGLSRRESLVIQADSFFALGQLADSWVPDSVLWANTWTQDSILRQADREYPDDPFILYRLGEMQVHREMFGRNPDLPLETFSRVVQLDPGFAPAYWHLIELQLIGPRDIEAARTSIVAYLSSDPTDPPSLGARIVDALLNPDTRNSSSIPVLLDTASSGGRGYAYRALKRLADSAETAVLVAQAMHDADPSDPRSRSRLGMGLAYRGHLLEALEFADGHKDSRVDNLLFSELALTGAVSTESAARVFESWLERDIPSFAPTAYLAAESGVQRALSWWASTGDTSSIKRARAKFQERIAADTSRTARAILSFAVTDADFFLALGRRDTVEALRQAERFPDYSCEIGCSSRFLAKARLLIGANRDGEALRILERGPNVALHLPLPTDVWWRLERARVNQRLGNTERAIYDYSFVADVWRNADEMLQPYVAEAREALARLIGEPSER